MSKTNRKFISIYLPLIDIYTNKKIAKTITIPFNLETESDFYNAVKSKNTKELKKQISIFSYNQLEETAKKEKRTKVDLIKLRLKERLIDNKNYISKNIDVNEKKMQKWIKALNKIKDNTKSNQKLSEIINFLNNVLK